MSGSEICLCTIPAGRKDGKKAKGTAFDRVAGVGDRPGEEYAALNVLHQLERGKPLERLLAPEFRDVWIGLDKRFEEYDAENKQRVVTKERRKAQAERRAKIEQSKESATISISATSRKLIESAIVQPNGSTLGGASHQPSASSSGASGIQGASNFLKNELMGMGFSKFDAVDVSQRFSDVTSALDYLCLNLDEAELPRSFAPTADVEVVRFTSSSREQSKDRVDSSNRDHLMRLTCLSKQAVERALLASGGEMTTALGVLYNTLTHNMIAGYTFQSLEENIANLACEERATEASILSAIYGEDATVGPGSMPGFENSWAAVVRLQKGLNGIGVQYPVIVAVVDLDGFYPFSVPAVIVGTNFRTTAATEDKLHASYRRVLMRAATGEVLSAMRSLGGLQFSPGEDLVPTPVVHDVVSFLGNVSENQLMTVVAKRNEGTCDTGSGHMAAITPSVSARNEQMHPKSTGRATRRPVERPMRVEPLKSSPQLVDMKSRRSMLPAHKARNEIIEKIRHNQVVVVSGATGSGKTTQVPQFLLEDAAMAKEPMSIVCTQPRRIAAMSVAERVAAERCQRVGESVGYQVKLNSKRSRATRVVFCTTGVLLRKLQGDPQLESLTHVLVDEVHERSVETDFVLLLLREIAARRPSIRIVLMSATLDANKFAEYFSSTLSRGNKRATVPIVSIPGRTFPVEELYLEDAVRFSQYRLRPGARYAKRVGKVVHKGKYGMEPAAGTEFPKQRITATAAAGRAYIALDDERQELDGDLKTYDAQLSTAQSRETTISETQRHLEMKQTVGIIDESIVNVDLIGLLVWKLNRDGRMNRDGAILIFLPGVADISAVVRKLSTGDESHSLWPLPLHSMMSPEEQTRVFSKPPRGKRKVICSTNIAETSITVDDVTVVIDTLRSKQMGYDALNRSSVLEEQFISKAAAQQRAGRAGRVSSGTCYRLVRKNTFDNRIAAEQTPEIQRVALEHLVLNMLSIIPEQQSQNDPHLFLGKAIDPPAADSITSSITNLIEIGAMRRQTSGSQKVELTALGKHLTGMPVDARVGKLLIFGSLFSCTDAALTIAATLAERSPFYAPFDKREEARAARAPFVWGKSDLLTYVRAYNAWRDIRESRGGYAAEQAFCSKNFLARKTLQAISDGRRQLADALADAGFGLPGAERSFRGWEREEAVNQFSDNLRVVKAVVCAALYPNIARIDLPDKTYYEVAGGTVANKYNAKDLRLRSKSGERLFLHPESVNFHQGNFETRWLAYFAKVKTSRLFVRDSSMVSPFAILLFGGEINVQHKKGQMSVDNWVIFKAPAKVAVLARELRRQLDGLLMRKFENADIDLAEEGKTVNEAIIRLITTES
ncbi:similar to DEAH (Asp-Glu-Ala-Asp/His) box polypeptide 57 [Chondrus crispus]|uniref:Similar to DEAH (Asp-Glu-Ala-Asp/His) box polypeptide 57 n=1 Tax=Chondrus crispus TaxID=2769 RepID=R7QDV5_CHOCR|nr:similar to DEAH (Asp-Glu-Ala-Asp/His) box polypeptide 57 [Chondrus crispus]CDF36697.1 similar to DEAH (Asp-Glu-Ala-Asp/His) box polypeptide 57 [Chondrus crispus]|eukprot:XP_005716516.1 similar to DEAH (Asp-Glu-Ala-Asp/His) box polypeptide 57 [Chondrus crispus]